MAISPIELERMFLRALARIRNFSDPDRPGFYDPRAVARDLFRKLQQEGLPYTYNDVWQATSAASRAYDYAQQLADNTAPPKPPRGFLPGAEPGITYRVVVTYMDENGRRHETAVTVSADNPLSTQDVIARAQALVLNDASFNSRYSRLVSGIQAGEASGVIIATYSGR